MVRPRVVGPNLPSGVRRPDRSVRLVDPRRPILQMLPESRRDPRMGTVWEPGPDRELDPYHDIDIIEELDSQGIDWEGLTHGDPAVEAAKAEVRKGDVSEEGVDEAEMRAVSPVGPQMLPNVPVPNFQGPQVHAMAGEPPRWDRAHPEGQPGPYEPPPELDEEQRERNRRGIKEGRKRVKDPLTRGEEVTGTGFPDPRNPEARSMDAAMLQELFLQRASEPDYGYFGKTGDKVGSIIDSVGDMSASDRALLVGGLIASGLLMVGSGGALMPAGAALLGGAGVGALTSAP
jgi:hypothetical protein